MPGKETNPPAVQLRIPFTREARLALLAAIDPKIAGVSRRTWINVAELLTQVELTTGADGCFCYCQTLAERMFQKNGIPRSTFFRVRHAAGRLGLLVGEERHNRQGKTSSAWRVQWDRVVALAARSGYVQADAPPGAADGFSPGGKSETDRRQNGTDRSYSGTDRSQSGTMPYRGISSTVAFPLALSLGSTVDKGVDQKSEFRNAERGSGGAGRAGSPPPASRLPIAAARALAHRIERAVGRCTNARDWQLAAKVALLSYQLGEAWLWGAVEAVRRRSSPAGNPWAYFTRCLQDATRQRHKCLNRELARITLPAELAAYDGGAWQDRERLCVSAEP